MKKTLAFSLIFSLPLGVAACGDNAKFAPVSETVAAPQVAVIQPAAIKPDLDKELAKRVARAMEDARLHGIDAVAAAGIVTLWGTTVSAKERDRAAEIARNVEGVDAVENRIAVVSGS